MKKIKNGTFIGIDVGASKKGFHGIVLKNKKIISIYHSLYVEEICCWCDDFSPDVIAIDAPCGWSKDRLSREAERNLIIKGKRIPCFSTPTKKISHTKKYYEWILNGEKLYEELRLNRFNPIETYPYGIIRCLLDNYSFSKLELRKKILKKYDISSEKLLVIDEYDATLCAINACFYFYKQTKAFGNQAEGYIILPAIT